MISVTKQIISISTFSKWFKNFFISLWWGEFNLKQFNQIIRIPHNSTVETGKDFFPNHYFCIGDKYLSRMSYNLAVLIFYCRLQLIRNFVTKGLVPSHPRSPVNLKCNTQLIKLEKLQLAWPKYFFEKSVLILSCRQTFHFAVVRWYQPETIQSEH
jgi:hypothetical protein